MNSETRPAEAGPAAAGSGARLPWEQMLWFGVLLLAAYAPVLWRLGLHWSTDDDMGHGFFVPVVAGYMIWQQRERLLALPSCRNWLGLLLVAWGAAQLYLATLGAELFLARTAFIISLIGAVLLLGGVPLLRAVAFPLGLLFLMVPIPAIIFNQITFPLQLFASDVAQRALMTLGVPVLREGNILELPSQRLSVVEACSGIRSLLTLTFLSLVYAYFFDKKVWMRAALLVATLPIAIGVNAARVTITGLLAETNPELAAGLFHTAEGWVMFLLALLALLATHALINRIYQGVTRGRR